MSKVSKDYLWTTFLGMAVCWGTAIIIVLSIVIVRRVSRYKGGR